MQELDKISQEIRTRLQAENTAREEALRCCRKLAQLASRAIIAIHREERAAAQELLAQGEGVAREIHQALATHPAIYYTGYVHSAQKEYAEARLLYGLVEDEPVPDPSALGVEGPAYLHGLGEAAGELRRHALDLIRKGTLGRAEEILIQMEEIHQTLSLFDFPDALTYDLRRTNDMVRGVLERTRGDLTMALRQQELERALRELEKKLGGPASWTLASEILPVEQEEVAFARIG